jgi:hypothetical protein
MIVKKNTADLSLNGLDCEMQDMVIVIPDDIK